MRIYLQDSTGAVSRPESLDDAKLADIGLLWVDIDDPGGYSGELKGADFQLELPQFDQGTDGANPRLQQRADDLLITWSFPAGFEGPAQKLKTSAVLILLGDNYLVTIHDGLGEIADIRDDFEKGDYENPLYSILDATALADLDVVVGVTRDIDVYLDSVLEGGRKRTESGARAQYDVNEIKRLKRRNVEVRMLVTAHRAVLLRLTRRGMKCVSAELARDLMDVVEEYWRIDDEMQSNSDLITASLDIQLNVTMKRLTTIATIFMPLTFLVGLYGMNFKYMPELTWRFGYLFAWTTIVVIAIAMVVIAKRKGWF